MTEWCERKGWNENIMLGNMVANLHSEISEAWEEVRNGHAPSSVYCLWDNEGNAKPEGFPIELADLFIRLVHLCKVHDIDLEAMIERKMSYNEHRPYRHGGKIA